MNNIPISWQKNSRNFKEKDLCITNFKNLIFFEHRGSTAQSSLKNIFSMLFQSENFKKNLFSQLKLIIHIKSFLLHLIPAGKVSATAISPESIVFYNEWPKSTKVFAFYFSNVNTAFNADAIALPLPLLPLLARHGLVWHAGKRQKLSHRSQPDPPLVAPTIAARRGAPQVPYTARNAIDIDRQSLSRHQTIHRTVQNLFWPSCQVQVRQRSRPRVWNDAIQKANSLVHLWNRSNERRQSLDAENQSPSRIRFVAGKDFDFYLGRCRFRYAHRPRGT